MNHLADRISGQAIDLSGRLPQSPYVHSASLGLGGSPDECAALRCRLERISELARYAALYSDGVFIHNFFSDYSSIYGHAPSHDSKSFRERVADDIRVLLAIRPLVNAGVITLFTPHTFSQDEHICTSCFAKLVFGAEAGQRFIKARDELAQRYLTHTSIDAFWEDGYYCLECCAPESLLEHGVVVLSSRSPSAMKNIPRTLARVDRGEHVPLSRTECKKLGIHHRLAAGAAESVVYHAATSTALGTSLLTHRELDIDILCMIADDPINAERNTLLAQHAQAIVPFAIDVPIEHLVKLRRREQEAFARFQAAIHRTIVEVQSCRGSFTEQDARQVYGDIIRPRIAELEQKS